MSNDLQAALLSGENLTVFAAPRAAGHGAEGCGKPTVKLIQPEYLEEYRRRALSIVRRNQWKYEGSGANFAGQESFAEQAAAANVSLVDVAAAPDGKFLYAAQAEQVCALFRVDPETDTEQRLFHSNEARIGSLAPRMRDGQVVCSLMTGSGTADLGIIDVDHGGITELTEGDSLDEAPSWVEGGRRQLVYQSAGVARDKGGFVQAIGPRSLQRLDLDRGTVEDVHEEEGYDLLCPRQMADGTLYYLRRPWKKPKGATPVQWLGSLAMFPFHFVAAIFQVVHLLTRSESKTPLLPQGRRKPQDNQDRLWLWGALVEESGAERTRGTAEADQALVPDNWELRRLDPDGSETLVAKSVVSFDVDDQGDVVFTNGRALFRSDGESKPQKLGKVKRATRLVLI